MADTSNNDAPFSSDDLQTSKLQNEILLQELELRIKQKGRGKLA
jgi:hypothetical protein